MKKKQKMTADNRPEARRDIVYAPVIDIRHLAPGTFVLRIERESLDFLPGQYFILSPAVETTIAREYSVYSGENDPYLEFLIREVESGSVSKALGALSPGDEVMVDGPYGNFLIEEPGNRDRNYCFVASGTGIAPFRSFVRSYPGLDYRILHGIRFSRERYDAREYGNGRYTSCVSREDAGDFHGRVTDYLNRNPVDPGCHCYFSGNSLMVYEALRLVQLQGIPRENLFTEVFFWG